MSSQFYQNQNKLQFYGQRLYKLQSAQIAGTFTFDASRCLLRTILDYSQRLQIFTGQCKSDPSYASRQTMLVQAGRGQESLCLREASESFQLSKWWTKFTTKCIEITPNKIMIMKFKPFQALTDSSSKIDQILKQATYCTFKRCRKPCCQCPLQISVLFVISLFGAATSWIDRTFFAVTFERLAPVQKAQKALLVSLFDVFSAHFRSWYHIKTEPQKYSQTSPFCNI